MDNAILRKIAEAKASGGGNITKDGKYTFAVNAMMIEAKFNGTMFIVEHYVKSAEAVEPDVEPNKPGTICSIVYNLDKNVSAPGNTKAYVLALFGYKEDEVTQDEFVATLGELCGPAQPARGMLIRTETFRKPIQKGPNAGKPFTGHRWQHVEQTEDQIATERKYLDDLHKSVAA